jgi:hypothetical protein
MSKLLLRHTVQDYRKWRPVFDADVGRQKASGLNNASVYRAADDNNLILIIWDIEDRQRASEFLASPALKAAMKQAGVVGELDISFQDVV